MPSPKEWKALGYELRAIAANAAGKDGWTVLATAYNPDGQKKEHLIPGTTGNVTHASLEAALQAATTWSGT